MSIPDKLAAGLVSLAALVPSFFTNDVTTPVLGVGVTTIAGAVLGTYAAIGYDDAVRPRGKLFAIALSTVIIASAATGVAPRYAGWQWMNATVEGGVAALCAVLCYYLLPELIPAARRLIRSFKLSDLNLFAIFRKGGAPADPPAQPPSDGAPDK